MPRVILILSLLASLLLPLSASADPIGWSAPRQLAPDTAAFVGQAGHSTDARDTALWTLWFEDRGTGQNLLKASRFSNGSGSWSEPEAVASGTTWGSLVETAVDAELNPWAAWSCSWSRRQDDSWTIPDTIPTEPSDSTQWTCITDLTADPEQGIWAIWARLDTSEIEWWMLVLSSYWANDSWTRPALVERASWPLIRSQTPVLTAPPWGRVRSVWLRGDLPYSATWNGDSWVGHECISRNRWAKYLSVCSDSIGGTWVTWSYLPPYDSVFYAHHDGTGWTDAGVLGSGFVHRGMLCCDDRGWIWALWTQFRGASDTADICVRYFDGDSWSDRSVLATCARMIIFSRIAAGLGRVWVTWTQEESAGRELLYYSHTLPPGIAEQEQQRLAAVQVSPSVVHAGTAIRLFGLQPGQTVQLLDATGRMVGAASQPRPRDFFTSSLSPGVYFVRVTGGGQPVSRKVLVVR